MGASRLVLPTSRVAAGDRREPYMRVCFRLQVKRGRLDEYRRRHEAVWPDMVAALAASGWRNYSLFLDADGLLIGYFETDSLDDALAGMAATEVNMRWQAHMSDLFEGNDGRPADQAFVVLPEVFNLDDQLLRASSYPLDRPLGDPPSGEGPQS